MQEVGAVVVIMWCTSMCDVFFFADYVIFILFRRNLLCQQQEQRKQNEKQLWGNRHFTL